MRTLCSDCALKISEPTVVLASATLQVSHSDQVIKSSISNLGDKNIKETISLQRKVILGFLKGRDTFDSLPTGSGKSLIYQLAVRVTAKLSSVWQGSLLYGTSSFSCLSFECCLFQSLLVQRLSEEKCLLSSRHLLKNSHIAKNSARLSLVFRAQTSCVAHDYNVTAPAHA